MITAVYSYKWRLFLGGVGILPFFFSLLYVRTSCVSRHPVSYIVSACFVYRVSREHSTAAVGFHFGVHRTILSLRARRPHSENESSPFFGMYQKQHHQQQEWSLLYTRTSGVFFFFGLGSCPFFFLYCTYVPRVCRVIPCPILVRASYHTVFSCDNNSVFITPHSEQHQLFWWDV